MPTLKHTLILLFNARFGSTAAVQRVNFKKADVFVPYEGQLSTKVELFK